MTFTISFAWWAIPTLITMLGFLWVAYWPADESGCFGSSFERMLRSIPALAVSMIAWIVAAFCK